MSNMSQRVRALRRELRISQQQLADRLGTTMMTVHRWENGKAVPSPMATILLEHMEGKIECCPLCFRKFK
jgi:DNA-binding transcriptional regulator YiaG